MNKQQRVAAEKSMSEWLSHQDELGKAPAKIECAKEFDLHGLHYYIFRFKQKLPGEWMLGVCGGYEDGSEEHCGHVYSRMTKYNDKTAVEDAVEMVEAIRSYWMERARMQEAFQEKFKANTEFRTGAEIDAWKINSQFVRSESRYFLTAGETDCPSGRLFAADPLAYLPGSQFFFTFEKEIPAGRYPVEVSICRNSMTGIRMCTARLKIKDTEAVKFVRAEGTAEAISEEGTAGGFPVDAGMMTLCDAQTAGEYRAFIKKWYESHPDGNHYDDYFAAFFAESEKMLPAYQREGGDFIEWTNPDTGRKMVMIASGFGDGFYCCYYGYDAGGDLCQIIVPMVDPSLFGDED